MGAEDEVLVLSGCPEWDKHGVAVVGLRTSLCHRRYLPATRFPTRSTVNRQPAGMSVVAP